MEITAICSGCSICQDSYGNGEPTMGSGCFKGNTPYEPLVLWTAIHHHHHHHHHPRNLFFKKGKLYLWSLVSQQKMWLPRGLWWSATWISGADDQVREGNKLPPSEKDEGWPEIRSTLSLPGILKNWWRWDDFACQNFGPFARSKGRLCVSVCVFFFDDSLVMAKAQLQLALWYHRRSWYPWTIHNYCKKTLRYLSWLRCSTLKRPQDTLTTFDLWRLVSLEYLKRLQPVLRATSRAGKCSNQVVPVVSLWKCGMFFQAIQDDPTWFKMGVQGLPWFFWKRFLWTKMRVFECFWQLQDAHWSCGIVLVGYVLMKDHEEVHSWSQSTPWHS